MRSVSREELPRHPGRRCTPSVHSPGVWFPQDVVERVSRLRLRPASVFQVLFVVLATQWRYGGNEARLTASKIAEMTGLGYATVKRALAALTSAKLLVRPRPRGCLRVVLDAPVNSETVAPVRTKQIDPHANVPSVEPLRRFGFTAKQQKLIDDVIVEASEILGSDALVLSVPTKIAERLGLKSDISYADALAAVKQSGDKLSARNLVSAVLALRNDDRVQGRDLDVACNDCISTEAS
jgi:hypothetical protein